MRVNQKQRKRQQGATKSWRIGFRLAVFVLVVACVYSYFDKQAKLEQYAVTRGSVMHISVPSGIRTGPMEVECRYQVAGKLYEQTFERRDLHAAVGDCVAIQYSVVDPHVSRLDYTRGAVTCEQVEALLK